MFRKLQAIGLVLFILSVCAGENLKYRQESDIEEDLDDALSGRIKHGERNIQESMHNDGICGYEVCDLGKDGYLNVHVVPHSHDDVGWRRTVDEYYYEDIQYILDSVTDALLANATRRFIYVEIAYFSRWWHQQNDKTRHQFKTLVNTGRLQFILGGWSMNDEACTHYSSIIDQHTLGFHFLMKNFGECGRPRVGWQIDPFGHSREQASLFAQFGFDGLFFGRLDYQDKDTRMLSKTMELMWKASQSLGDQSSLFTGINFNLYQAPDSFCFECGDPPIRDDPELADYNVDSRVNQFISVANHQAKFYSTNHIMLTIGNDFQYQNARVNFKNWDKLIKYTNALQASGSKINAIYSTPACYLYALNKANQTYTHKEDDFFPYAMFPHAFLTGFFSSRPALKGYERSVNNFFQVCKQLDALSQLGPETGRAKKLHAMRDAMGIVQHHDAVTGTEQQHVSNDYTRRLAYGVAQCQDIVNAAYSKLLPISPSSVLPPTFQFCSLLNVSYCSVTETSDQFAVVAYNPTGHAVSHWVRIPVSHSNYAVFDSKLNNVDAQIVPLSSATINLPDHAGSKAAGEVVFLAEIPAVGFSTYFIKTLSGQDPLSGSVFSSFTSSNDKEIIIKNKHLSVTFSGTTGLLKTLANLDKSITIDITQSLFYYNAYVLPWPPSGAYIFRPANSTVLPISPSVNVTLVQGSQVQEVRQTFGDWASQVVRLYNDTRHLEIEWTVGPIPVGDDKVGKEVISRFSSALETDATFYTDANGREIMQRIRNYRPTWKFNQTEPVAGNYFPVTSRIFIQDKKKNLQLTVLNDRSQGGTSLDDGDIELMLHRRLLMDENLGVGEPLNESGIDGKGLIVRGKHYVYLDDIRSSAQLHRDAGQRLYMAPYIGFAPVTSSFEDYAKTFHTSWSGLNGRLPANVHLLTLEQWEAGTMLLRIEHFYAKDEDQILSQPATVSLKDLFVPFTIKSVVELTLGANQLLSEAKRLQWNVQDFGTTTRDMSSFVVPVDPVKLEVVLNPMQIRTFQVSLKMTS